jgi:hypothetical protein
MSFKDAIIEGWQLLSPVEKEAMQIARLNAHYGAQVASSVGTTLLKPLPGYTHTNLEWIDRRRMLAGQPTDDQARLRGALRLQDLTLAVVDRNGGVAEDTALDGMTLAEAIKWMGEAVGRVKERDALDLKAPEHELPKFPVADGKPFEFTDENACRELSRWFQNADTVLRALFAMEDDAEPVRAWPHHFDIATRVLMDEYDDSDDAKAVTVGMSPGDEHIDEPYFYVTPWPKPKDPELVPLGGEGIWHREGWFGAALPASRLVTGDERGQLLQVQTFIDSALAAGRKMLGS